MFCFEAQAATRFYATSTVTQPVTPALFDGDWDDTTSNISGVLDTVKRKSTHALGLRSEATATTPFNVCLYRGVSSKPLAAQTISGTVKAQFYFSEANADADFSYACSIRVVSATGVFRGLLFENFPSVIGTEFAAGASGTSEANRSCPAESAVTPLVVQNGDYLVVEYGYTTFNSHTTSRQGRMEIGDDQTSDAPENETDTAEDTNDGWIEFSQDIQFAHTSFMQML